MKYCLIVLLSVVACGVSFAQTADDNPKNVDYKKFIERIAGQWTLQQIVDVERESSSKTKKGKDPQKTNDVETDQATNAMSKIEFYDDARYRMNNSQQAIDSGSYRLNEQHGILYLESDNDQTPVEWKIQLQGKRLSLTGRDGEATSRYRYVYQKTKENVVK